MSDRGPGLPPLLQRLLEGVLPEDRRDDVLGDLEESMEAYQSGPRAGARWARLRLWREATALLSWWSLQRIRTRRTTMGRDLLRDLELALRSLRRRPGFTLTAIGVLGLGIGAATTVLSLVQGIFFSVPPGVEQPDRLVAVFRSWAPGQGGGSLSHPDYAYYELENSTFSGLAAYGGRRAVSYALGGDRTDQLSALFVSADYFDVLGVSPARGRGFIASENRAPGAAPVVVVSDGFWKRALGGDASTVGGTIVLNGVPYSIIGVAPAGFDGVGALERSPDVWVPLAMFGSLTRAEGVTWWERRAGIRENWLNVVGRLAPGVTFEAARANMDGLSQTLEYAGRDPNEGVLLSRQVLYGPGQAATLSSLSAMLIAVVAIVLLISTANLGVLVLSRASTRTREIGIRTALGAGRGRVVRYLLAENVVIGLAGAAVGVGMAYASVGPAGALLPFAIRGSFRPDPWLLLLATFLGVGTALLAGLAPAWRASRQDVTSALETELASRGRSPLRSVLVVGQMALCLVLVAGAGLFARSFAAARSQPLGFATEDRLIVSLNLRAQGYSEDEGLAFLREAARRVGAVPGVRAVAATRQVAFQGDWSTEYEPPPEQFPDAPRAPLFVGLNTVGVGYFEVLEIAIVRGRAFGPQDVQGTQPAVVVNETLARTLWGDADPVGRTFPLDDEAYAVVGVAADATYYELGEAPVAQLYWPVEQKYASAITLVMRTAAGAPTLAPLVQSALREIDATLAFTGVSTLESVVEEVTARYEVAAVLVSLFAGLALLLASAGLYGVITFVVTRRTREIGVRMALGADRARVARGVLGSALRLAVVGLVLGVLGALALGRLIESMLYGVHPADPTAIIAAGAILLVVATLSSLAPARRATRIDPLQAIRAE